MTESTPTKTVVCCGGCEEQTGVKCGMCGVPQIIELTPEEIAQMEADRIAFEAQRAEEEAAKETLAALKESAKAKLVAGQPLTPEEAATIVL